MEKRFVGAVATWALLIFVCGLCRGDTSTPDCSAELLALAPCLAFVSNQLASPSQACCDALRSVVTETPDCLCELVVHGKNGTANTGLPQVNFTLVRQLPEDCGLQADVRRDVDRCRAAEGPRAPSPSPLQPLGSAGSPPILRTSLSLIVFTLITSIWHPRSCQRFGFFGWVQ